MAFRTPTFNILCDIYTFGTWPAGPARIVASPCQWRATGKPTAFDSANFIAFFSTLTEIVLPAATDVRGPFENPINNFDLITISAIGPAWAFEVKDVYDIGKGFTNEYRVAVVCKHAPWPVPIP